MSDDDIQKTISIVSEKLQFRLKQKGRGIFVSSHEIEGIINEEIREFQQCVCGNDIIGIETELINIAVAAIWGVASVRTGKMDWPKKFDFSITEETQS